MSTEKKTVVKVRINCGKCKKDVLKAVTKLDGINEVTVDADKGTLTVIGTVDPVMVANQLKKAGKFVEIVSVGPPMPPEQKTPKPTPVLPPCCKDCQLVFVGYGSYYDERPSCHIL